MKKLISCFLHLILLFISKVDNVYAQGWVGLGKGLNQQVKCLKADSVNHALYVGGNFNIADSNIVVNYIAKWDGTNWHAMANGAFHGSAVWSLEVYNDTIFAGATFYQPNLNGLSKWSGTSWDSVGGGINQLARCLMKHNTELYVSGLFDTVAGVRSEGVAKWNGTQWISFPFDFQSSFYYPVAMAIYQGNLYIGGNFYYSTGMNDMCYWDGNSMNSIGGGLNGGGLYCMAVYMGELYIGGFFTKANGDAGDYIMKWNGSTLSEVGGGLNQQVFCMKVYYNELYVGGGFTQAGGINADHIAIWNGSNWRALSNSVFNNGIAAIEFLDNELYAAGGFQFIDGVRVNYIAKYTGPIGISETDINKNIFLSPAPTHDHLKITSPQTNIHSSCIFDITGKLLLNKIINARSFQLDVTSLAAGLYFLVLETPKGTAIKKFVKE